MKYVISIINFKFNLIEMTNIFSEKIKQKYKVTFEF